MFQQRRHELTRLFIQEVGDINFDPPIVTLLYLATNLHRLDLVKILLARHANVNFVVPTVHKSFLSKALAFATRSCDSSYPNEVALKVVSFLLEKGANANTGCSMRKHLYK